MGCKNVGKKNIKKIIYICDIVYPQSLHRSLSLSDIVKKPILNTAKQDITVCDDPVLTVNVLQEERSGRDVKK